MRFSWRRKTGIRVCFKRRALGASGTSVVWRGMALSGLRLYVRSSCCSPSTFPLAGPRRPNSHHSTPVPCRCRCEAFGQHKRLKEQRRAAPVTNPQARTKHATRDSGVATNEPLTQEELDARVKVPIRNLRLTGSAIQVRATAGLSPGCRRDALRSVNCL